MLEHLHDWSQHKPSLACKSQGQAVPDTQPRTGQGRNKKRTGHLSIISIVTESQILNRQGSSPWQYEGEKDPVLFSQSLQVEYYHHSSKKPYPKMDPSLIVLLL